MGKFNWILVVACLFSISSHAHATPVNLTSFHTFSNNPESVILENGTVTFQEESGTAALWFYDDIFNVDVFAETLSFNYDFQGPANSGDFLVLNINNFPVWSTTLNGSGTVIYGMQAYRGQQIAIDWMLSSNFPPHVLGTTAKVSNIDLKVAPVPEPSSALLMLTGILAWMSRKKRS